MKSIALNLKNTYEVSIEGDEIYSDGLNKFLEVSQDDLYKFFDVKSSNKDVTNSNKKELYSVEDAKNKAIEVLEANNYIDTSTEEADVYYVDEIINDKNKQCYSFGIVTEESEFDFRILIEKETLSAIFMYSDGVFEEIEPIMLDNDIDLYEDKSNDNFIEAVDANDTQKKYIESKLTIDKAINLVTSLPFFKENSSTYPLVLDGEYNMVSVGNKLGYLMTVRSYGEVVDSRMADLFLDIDTGNIYNHDYFDTTYIDLNDVLCKIEI